MTAEDAIRFVAQRGIVLESARGPVPNLAETVAGEAIRGSWWKHPSADQIFRVTRAVRSSPDVLVCRLLGGKITYVHRRLWPALVRIAERIGPMRLAAVREEHTPQGKHCVHETPFPRWAPAEVRAAAARLSEADAAARLPEFFAGEIELPPGRRRRRFR